MGYFGGEQKQRSRYSDQGEARCQCKYTIHPTRWLLLGCSEAAQGRADRKKIWRVQTDKKQVESVSGSPVPRLLIPDRRLIRPARMYSRLVPHLHPAFCGEGGEPTTTSGAGPITEN